MNKNNLTDSIELGPSQLYVSDLGIMREFYADLVGFEILGSTKNSVLLGHGDKSIVELVEKPQLTQASPREAGLFHNAIVYSSRGELSRAVERLLTRAPQYFSGTGDHLVSEAFYFNDPDGNGVELYFDRPRDSWQWIDGRVVMDTLYIDPVEYISAHRNETTSPEKWLGHIHLRIGNVLRAEKFYVDLLGFDITAKLPGALFVSIGGYHHHIALNTWLSEGAGMRKPALGLANATMKLGDDNDITRLAERLKAAGHEYESPDGQLVTLDPWGNRLTFMA